MYRRGAFVSLCLLALRCSEAEDVPDDLGAACQRQAECAGERFTAQLERSCREQLLAEYDEASTYGCANQHADWVACLATTRGQCPPADAADGVMDPCAGQLDAFQRCQASAGM